jgi:two-component system sensor histidine kinase PilS (NtrC family)
MTIDIGLSANHLVTPSGPAGFLFNFQDVTKVRKLERDARMQHRLAAVGEMAAGIAHEIRNPLASISGSAQVLRGSATPGSSERRLMEIVVSESQRLSSILEDFLKYVKPRERLVEEVDAAAALKDVAMLLSHSDERLPGHEIVVDIVPESVVLPADAGQIRQIFWNLARNALAAMPDGGRLAISARLEGESWVVAVSDEGRGMTDEERDRLFTPFAHSVRGGTGLGLAIVYRIVEEHGGSIRVDTSRGTGTTISIALPVRAARREVA